ncbi:MAG: prepilin-type N-terminal cleavage/methylation domain-containing protein [Lachnospiraceae bacterium]|nr:prepilin-type N-terminal cleavage/methylation domain-containing protein [Lachnospiraceae bacterium]
MKKEMNNKGFSLVELIIVIAIMVVLIAVLAPQYLKYVEKSRVASDQSTIVEYINAMQVIAADPEITLASTGASYTLTSGTGATAIAVSTDLATLLENQGMLDATAAAGGTLQSTAYTDANLNIILKYDSTAKIWTVVNNGGDVEVSGTIKTTP